MDARVTRGGNLKTEADTTLAFVGCAATNCIANATWWMQPLLIGYWVTVQHMSESAAGLVVSVEMGSMALFGALLARVLTRGRLVSWGLAGLAFAIVASWASIYASSFVALMALRGLVGLGIAAVMMISYVAVSRTALPDKTFARVNLANLIFGVVLVGSLPLLRNLFVGVTPLHALLLSLIVLILPAVGIPRSLLLAAPGKAGAGAASPAVTDGTTGPPHWVLRIWVLAAAGFAMGIVSGMAFGTFALIGAQTGLSQAAIDQSIAIGIFTAIPLSALAAVIGTRFGRLLPLLVALSAVALTIPLLALYPGPLTYVIASCLNVGGLYLGLPFLFGAGAALDPGGKGAAYVGSGFTFAGALSPFIGGLVLEYLGIGAMVPIALTVAVMAAAAFIYVERGVRLPQPQTA